MGTGAVSMNAGFAMEITIVEMEVTRLIYSVAVSSTRQTLLDYVSRAERVFNVRGVGNDLSEVGKQKQYAEKRRSFDLFHITLQLNALVHQIRSFVNPTKMHHDTRVSV